MARRVKYESDDSRFDADAYTVRGHGGVAWRVMGWETEPGPTEWYDADAGEMVTDEEPGDVRTGRVVCIMVGDDSRFVFDEEDVTPIAREDYCGECGQIGCGGDGYDREAAASV